jgi:hypothetical protein
MADHRSYPDSPDQEGEVEERIRELEAELQKKAGGFLRSLLALENGPFTTLMARLTDDGVEPPPPDSLSDEQLSQELAELIRRLARLRVFLYQTNHLSDRELYAHLWHESLREEIPIGSEDDEGNWIFDLLGTGSEEHARLFMKFYADEECRARWRRDFPDFVMPPHEDAPYDRDRHLPGPHDELDEEARRTRQ